ncbi:glycosyltransferase family 8 protein [Paenibacillus thailandensis]|uniref:Glycosyltransferase family 8 protein n=1 Tax=Paenibacillus thailandensis TaxID=393250 RepID=A0ABW5QW27_9BACL
MTATNNKFAKPLGVMLYSLLSNTKSASQMIIYIIESDLSPDNKNRLEKVVVNAGASVKFLTIPQSMYSGLKTRPHLPQETYYRLAIPKLLDKKISKALYLDGDIIVKNDITRLWKIKLGDYYVAAVRRPKIPDQVIKRLGITKKSDYFNAGVLLMNLKKWREHKISEKILEFGKKKFLIKFPSQDPMNAVLKGKWLKLNRKWNYTSTYARMNPNIDPYIIHYSGPDKKPWDNDRHVFRHEYLKYEKELEWDVLEEANVLTYRPIKRSTIYKRLRRPSSKLAGKKSVRTG